MLLLKYILYGVVLWELLWGSDSPHMRIKCYIKATIVRGDSVYMYIMNEWWYGKRSKRESYFYALTSPGALFFVVGLITFLVAPHLS